ncbi:MAG: hypothetical protein JRJ03_09155 [Deltaproteobacteria bacterium]|nr:hypothetical protein [Deltaproteobacteria bacterium]MBW2065087.1 hypothetical protein [Deltaproteobacteria bacterium]
MEKSGIRRRRNKKDEGWVPVQIKVNYVFWKRLKAAAAMEDTSLEEILDKIIREYIERNHSYLLPSLQP